MAVLTRASGTRVPWWTAVAAALGLAAFAWVAWSIYTLFAVESAARTIAASDPYCVQVTSGKFDSRPVERHTDLLGWNILVGETNAGGSEDYKWTFHAVLVVARDGEQQLYNWSHRERAFLPVTEQAEQMIPVNVACTPAAGFLDALGW